MVAPVVAQLTGVDPWNPDLTDSERRMLLSLVRARIEYIEQGRGREAHAIGKSILIVWHFINRVDLPLELPTTDFGTLA